MPKSTRHHSLDGDATIALKKIFPSNWLFKKQKDIHSGREYSEDLIIEIVDDSANENVTGIEFGVQNKTRFRRTKNYISVNLMVDDLDRIFALQRPFLLHVFDKASKSSYWIWLHEWYAENYKPNRKSRKSVTVKIPHSQVLDEKAIKVINAYATWDHRKRIAEKKADLVTRHDPNYSIDVEYHEHS